MVLCYIFFLNGLVFTIAFYSPAITSELFSNYTFKQKLNKYCHNRIKRDDRLKYRAVCSELDKTEDTPFIAMVITRNPGRLLCMGSIIDEYHVLTAKRCFEKNDASAIMIIAGYQSPYYGKNSQVKFVEKVIKNKMELAILLLKKPFLFSETVKAIRLIGPDKIAEEFKPAYENPFKTFGIVGIEIPKYLQQGDYLPKMSAYYMIPEPPIDKDNCSEPYQNDDLIEIDEKFMFCTNGKSEFCWTGIGSPTVVIMEKNYVQIGVVVMGMCTTSKPDNGTSKPDATKPNAPKPDTSKTFVNYKAETEAKPDNGRKEDGKPNGNKKDAKDNYVPNIHIRIDKFHKWIKANSYIDLK